MNGLTTIDKFKKTLFLEEKTITNLVGDKNREKFLSACVYVFQSVPKLQECSLPSLVNAFLEMARLELYPSNSLGEAFVIPYKGKASFQLGYKGCVTLFWRAGCQRVDTRIVYANDEFKEELGMNPTLHHVPAPADKRGEPVRAYAVVKYRGETFFRSMAKEEIMKVAKMSQSYQAVTKPVAKMSPTDASTSIAKPMKMSPWSGESDPNLWMWQKTVLKQLAKLMPKNERLARAIELDNISERGGFFADTGEVVEAPWTPAEDEKIENGKAKKENLRNDSVVNS